MIAGDKLLVAEVGMAQNAASARLTMLFWYSSSFKIYLI